MKLVGDCSRPATVAGTSVWCRSVFGKLPHVMLAIAVIGTLTASIHPVAAQDATSPPTAEAAGVAADRSTPTLTARLVIDFGDGVEVHFTQLKCAQDSTVWSLLQLASKHPRGIDVKHRGRRDTLLVTEIEGVKNQGDGRNWIFRVNDDLGERSAGIQPVKPGDAILWRFETYQ